VLFRSGRSAGILQIGEGNYFRSGLAFYTNNTADATTDWSERMRISMDGNVGIGTASPSAGSKLEVIGKGDQLGSTGFYVNSSFKDDNNVGVFICHDDTVNNTGAIAGINQLSFVTYGGSSPAWGERMKITGAGNVGIGTASPSHLLQVTGGDGSIVNMVVNNDNVALRMSAYTNSHGEIRVETNHPLVFKTNGNNERLRITNTGNVGIGNSNPTSAKLVIREDSSYGLRLEDATGHYFRVNTGGDTEIRGDVSSGAITALAKGTQFSSTGYYVSSTFKDVADNCGVILGHNDTANGVGVVAGINQLAFLTYGTAWVQALLLDGSQNATFAGDITTPGNIILSGAANEIIKSNGSIRLNIDSDANQTDRIFIVSTGANSELFRVDESGNGTFAGTTTVEGGILHLGKADTASGHVNAKELMTFNIDTDNDDTNRYFGFYVNGESGSGTELLKILETGDATFAGDVTVDKIKGSTYSSNSFLDFDYDETASINNTTLASIARVNYIADTNGNDGSTAVAHAFMTGTTDIDTATSLLTILNNGNATFAGAVSVAGGALSISGDGSNAVTLTESDSGDFTIDAPDDIRLDAGGGDVVLRGAGTEFGRLSNSSGDFVIQNITADKDIIFKSDNGGGGVQTYFFLDGSAEQVEFNKSALWTDNDYIKLGTGGDFEMHHNGVDTIIGNQTGDLKIRQFANDKDIIFDCDDGSGGVETYFYLDGSAGGSDPATVFPDNSYLHFGGGFDLNIGHNGSTSYITNNTGDLYIRNNSDDGDIIFQSDNGAGGLDAYLVVDGTQHTIDIFKQTHFYDNVKATFGHGNDLEIYHDGSNSYINDAGTGDLLLRRGGAGGLNITGTGVIINGEADINGNAYISGDLGVAGNIYQTESGTTSGIGVFMPMVKGGLSVTSSQVTTGRLRIKVPTYKSRTMQTFYVDIYEYNTDRSATYRVSGYNYNDTNATWYNTSAVALFDSDNRDLTVRFGADTSASEQYVAIGEVNTTWDYVQVVVRDYLGGYDTSVSEATAAFEIEFVTTDNATYNVNHDNNQPFANWSKIESIPSNVTNALPTTGGTMSGALHIDSGSSTSQALIVEATSDPLIRFRENGSSAGYIQCTLADFVYYNAGGGKFSWLENGGVEKMSLTDAGQLTVAGEIEGGSLDINGNADISGTLNVHNNLSLQDSDILSLGVGDDLQIYHDGTDNHIDATSTLNIATGTSGVAVKIGHTTSEVLIADNLTIDGNLTTKGDFIIESTSNVAIKDTIITLNDGTSGTNGTDSNDIGIMLERHGNNKFMGWDESKSYFILAENTQDVSVAVTGLTYGTLQTLRANVQVDTIYFGDENPTSISALKDEDDMASNSATALATQQSIKAYADTKASLTGTQTIAGDKTFSGATSIGSTLASNEYSLVTIQGRNSHMFSFDGQSDHTLTLNCGSYYQAEVTITAHQTNGGTYNNIYIRGIWSNNHTSHHWDELERVGSMTGNTITITNGQNGSTTASGQLAIVHDNTQGDSFGLFTVNVIEHFGSSTHVIS